MQTRFHSDFCGPLGIHHSTPGCRRPPDGQCTEHPSAGRGLVRFLTQPPLGTAAEVYGCGGIGRLGFPQSVDGLAVPGLTETLAVSRAQGLRLGVVTKQGRSRSRRPKSPSMIRYLCDGRDFQSGARCQKPDQHIFTHALAAVVYLASTRGLSATNHKNLVSAPPVSGLQAIWLRGVQPWGGGSGAHLADCRTRRNRDYGAMCQQRNLTRGCRRRQTASPLVPHSRSFAGPDPGRSSAPRYNIANWFKPHVTRS